MKDARKHKKKHIHIALILITMFITLVGVTTYVRADTNADRINATAIATKQAVRVSPPTTVYIQPIPEFQYGRFKCEWIADGLRARNVSSAWVNFAVTVAQRESECCPNVIGGDRLNEDCSVKGHSGGDGSDTGAFQFNGIHYRTEAGMFCPEFTCSQKVILANPQMQLDMFVVMASKCGKRPWIRPYGCSPADIFN